MRDRILGCLLLILCGVVYWATLELPPPEYEPLGPAAFPLMLVGAIAVLAIPLILKPEPYVKAPPPPDGEYVKPTPWLSVWLLLAAVAFAAVMQTRAIPFSLTATGFLIIAMAILTRFEKRAWPATLIVSPIVGFGLEYIFKHIFIIDLP
jgi:hypothetical protein